MKRVLNLAAFLLLLSSSAHADWQWTKWGSKPADAIAAGAERGTPLQLRGYEPPLTTYTAPYETQGFRFTAYLTFGDHEGLLSVVLSPDDQKDCARLHNFLRNSLYNEPIYENEGYDIGKIDWEDRNNNNRVEYERVGKLSSNYFCSVTYKELPIPGRSGL